MKNLRGFFLAALCALVVVGVSAPASAVTTVMHNTSLTPTTTQAGTTTTVDVVYQFSPTTGSGTTRITILLPDFTFVSPTTVDGAYSAGVCGAISTGVTVTGVTLTNPQCHAQVGSAGTEFSVTGVSGVTTNSVIVVTFAAGTLNAPLAGTSTRLTAQVLNNSGTVIDDVYLSMLLTPAPLPANPHPMPTVDTVVPSVPTESAPAAELAKTGGLPEGMFALGLMLMVIGASAVMVKLNYRRGVEQLGSSLGS